MMYSAWTPLQLGINRTDVPILLVKSEFGSSNYKIWLTDLTYIWSESLDRRQIIQRAFTIDTSIDPSEDASQLRLFLQSVEDALSQRAGTSIDIVQSDNDEQLKLRTSTPLPGNLQPLEWHVQLISVSPFVMTTEFVVPLLSQQSTAQVAKISLLQQIGNKDHVIGRLVEKMQSDGVELSKVFPSAGSSKVGTGPNARRIVGKSVKGLAEFDVGEWQSRIAKEGGLPENMQDLLSSIMSTDFTGTSEGIQAPDVVDFGSWWKKLRHENSQPKPAIGGPVPSDTEEDAALEGDFQTQPTPQKFQTKTEPSKTASKLQMRESSPLSKQSQITSGSTTDESDDDLQSSKPRAFSPAARSRTSGGQTSDCQMSHTPPKLRPRKDTGSENSALHAATNLPAATSKNHHIPSSSDEDAMNLDKNLVPSKLEEEHTNSDQSKPLSKPRSNLGQIGGTKPKPAVEDAMDNPTPPVTKSKPKLGKIGGISKMYQVGALQRQASQPTAAALEEPQLKSGHNLKRDTERFSAPIVAVSRGQSSPKAPSPPRETDEEKANKKREQLKRELESKSQARAKKKRKF